MSVNRELEAKARDLAWFKGRVTNLAACPDGTLIRPEFVIGAIASSGTAEEASACQITICEPGVCHRKRDPSRPT